MRTRWTPWAWALAVTSACATVGAAAAQDAGVPAPSPLTVCVSEDNAPLSDVRRGQAFGFDVLVAQAVARELGRPLKLVPFEPEVEKEAMLTHEVNALLSAGVCELASGFPLLQADLGPATRARFKPADHPGAKPPRERALVALGTLVSSRPYQGSALVVVQRPQDGGPARRLGDLRGHRVAAPAGTLEGTLVALYGGGALTSTMVSMGQREDVWAALQQGRVDAILVPSTALDAHRQRQPQTPLTAGLSRALGINLGFVALAERQDVLDATNRVIDRASASGELKAWAQACGLTWLPPSQPAVVGQLDLAAWLSD